MRVLCVYTNLSRELQAAPPIGLAYVATAARRAGHEVEFCDLSTSRQPSQALAQALVRHRPRVVALSIRNIDNVVRQRFRGQLDDLSGLIADLTAQQPRPWIVIGGPAISVLGAACLDRIEADFAVVGEGEESFPQLLRLLDRAEEVGVDPRSLAGIKDVPGLCWRRDDVLRSNPPRRLKSFGPSGLESWVRWDRWERLGGTFPVQTKRGCRMSCTYCTYPVVEGRAERLRPVDEIVDELERIRRDVRPRTFELVDSTANLPPRHLEALCEAILRRGLRLRLTAMGMNPAAMKVDLLRLMRRAGFQTLMVTPESASAEMLASLRKGFGADHVRRAAEAVREVGVPSLWFFLLGGPGETLDTVRTTLDFAAKNLGGRRCLSVVFTGIRVLPGTELAQQLRNRGEIADETDLSRPVFFLDPALDETEVLEEIDRAIARNPSIVHAAEESNGPGFRLFHGLLHRLGVPPPYWRFSPWILALPTVRRARARNPVWKSGLVPRRP